MTKNIYVKTKHKTMLWIILTASVAIQLEKVESIYNVEKPLISLHINILENRCKFFLFTYCSQSIYSVIFLFIYLDKHFNCKYNSEYIVGRSKEDSLCAVRGNVWSFHCQSDAVETNKHEHHIVKPLLWDKPCTLVTETAKHNSVSIHFI